MEKAVTMEQTGKKKVHKYNKQMIKQIMEKINNRMCINSGKK